MLSIFAYEAAGASDTRLSLRPHWAVVQDSGEFASREGCRVCLPTRLSLRVCAGTTMKWAEWLIFEQSSDALCREKRGLVAFIGQRARVNDLNHQRSHPEHSGATDDVA